MSAQARRDATVAPAGNGAAPIAPRRRIRGPLPPGRALPADLLYGRLLATAAQHLLAGGPPPRARVRAADGTSKPLPLDRWLAPVDGADAAALALAEPPVLDLGCGPGRHLAALREAGRPGLGVDLSPVAVWLARERGAEAIRGSIFAEVPRAGWWRTALLLDGNIGIGGAPVLLLRRTRALLAHGGSAIVELDPAGAPTYRTRVRLEAPGMVSEWFAWARLWLDGIGAVAGRAGLAVGEELHAGGRWFARLHRR